MPPKKLVNPITGRLVTLTLERVREVISQVPVELLSAEWRDARNYFEQKYGVDIPYKY